MGLLRNGYPFTRARAVAIACGLLLGAGAAGAGGLRIENVKVARRDAATATVRFDIAWPNSWRHGSFHDAAWVFFKVRAEGETGWQHVRLVADKVLNPTDYGHDEGGTPLEFVVPDGDDGFTGMFVRRAAGGIGAVETRKVTAVWDFTANEGVDKKVKVRVRGFGVEMVYIPEGAFYLGRGNEAPAPWAGKGFGGMELNWFYRHDGDVKHTPSPLPFKYVIGDVYHWAVGTTKAETPPYRVRSADAIPTGRQKGSLWAVGITPEDDGELPAAFPNGYAAFYCMKFAYVTQGQYAGFLNTLTEAQAKARYYARGHGVAIKRSGKPPNYAYSAAEPDGRAPWVSWADGATFAAWAGLRPMTELEYEKTIRGPQASVPNDATTSYWGISDVQGLDIYERPVSVGNAVGRAFAGTHGRGTPELPADWPQDVRGAVFRGDYFGPSHCPTHLLTAGRIPATTARGDRSAKPYAGWRGARSAPPGDTAVGPVSGKLDLRTVRPVRLDRPFRLDGVLDEWGEPSVTISGAAYIFPTHRRFFSIHCDDPWRGAEDMSVKTYLGWDGEALCVAAEVTDDRHFNVRTGPNIWNGDALQMGLVTAEGAHWNVGLALTANGVVFHQWDGRGDALSKTAGRAVARDDAAKATRYELRLPLAVIGLKPGVECSFYFLFFDDDGTLTLPLNPDDPPTLVGQRYRLQWCPGIMSPFRRGLYPRFVLGE